MICNIEWKVLLSKEILNYFEIWQSLNVLNVAKIFQKKRLIVFIVGIL